MSKSNNFMSKTFTIDVIYGDEIKKLSKSKYKIIGTATLTHDEFIYEYFNLNDNDKKDGLKCYILKHLEGFPFWIQSEPVFVPINEFEQILIKNNVIFD